MTEDALHLDFSRLTSPEPDVRESILLEAWTVESRIVGVTDWAQCEDRATKDGR